MGINSIEFLKEEYSCTKCGWNGTGKDLKKGDSFDAGFEIHCPKCYERLPGLILYPTYKETMRGGSEEDKLVATVMNQFREKWLASLLKNIDQLPEVKGDSMAFVLREEKEGEEQYIVISYENQIIWKEICAYEYYERFMELGKLLKEKYGYRMVDLIPDVDGYSLYGDRASSMYQVEKFREELRTKI